MDPHLDPTINPRDTAILAMKLDDIATNPSAALSAMERYVNIGSPSGFTFVNTTSEHTRPHGIVPSFQLAEVVPRPGVRVTNIGHFPNDLFRNKALTDQMLVHPDMLGHPRLLKLAKWRDSLSSFTVEPTASSRTVSLCTNYRAGFLKLHYEGHLSRIIRRITLKHAQAAIENDAMIASLMENGEMPASFAYYRETAARVYHAIDDQGELSWGMVWRPGKVQCNSGSINYLVPAFSLFSPDLRYPKVKTILQQLGEIHSLSKVDFLIHELLLPLVHSYFTMVLSGGLQGEWHAQNVLFGFDSNWHCVATVLRDMESIDRDLPLMAKVGMPLNFASYPYKCLEPHGEIYAIRHSFMFDYKFGQYLLAPLIDHACRIWHISSFSIDPVVVDLVMSYLRCLPDNFFPIDGYWYKFANQLIDQTAADRPFVRVEKPRFRLVKRITN